MPNPTYEDMITLSSQANGLLAESIEERILTAVCILASAQNPDGSPNTGGTQGPPGPPGTFVWSGPWVSGGVYQTGNSVSYGGSAYVAKNNITSTIPPPQDPTNWDLLVSGGTNGAPGPPGPPGPPGTGLTNNTLVLPNVTSDPATPTGGGIVYVMNGYLYYKGPNGTRTTLGQP